MSSDIFRVLHVVRDLDEDSGGPSRSIPSLALSLGRCGIDSTVLFEDRGRPLATRNADRAVDYVGIKRKRVGSWQRQVHQFLEKQLPFDIVHSHGLWATINHASVAFALRRTVPFVVAPRGMLEPWALSHKSWRKRLGMLLYQSRDLRRASCLHTTGELESARCRDLGFSNDIAELRNGVHLPRNQEQRKNKSKKRRLLFLSRIHPIKGVDRLVKAWAKADVKEWECVIAGHNEAGYADEMCRLVASESVEHSIRIQGPAIGDDKWRLMQSADAFVLPSHSENFGIVVAEALACGLPVIASTGTPWQDLRINNCGWWVDNSIDSLAATISLVCSKSQKELSVMGHRGRKLVEKKCCWKSVAQEMADVYRWLQRGKSGKVPNSVINCEGNAAMPKRRNSTTRRELS